MTEETQERRVPPREGPDLVIGRMDSPRAVRNFLVRVTRAVLAGEIPAERAKLLASVARVVLEAHGLEMAQERIFDLWASLEELKSQRALPSVNRRLLPALRDVEQASEGVVQDVERSREFESDSSLCTQDVIREGTA